MEYTAARHYTLNAKCIQLRLRGYLSCRRWRHFSGWTMYETEEHICGSYIVCAHSPHMPNSIVSWYMFLFLFRSVNVVCDGCTIYWRAYFCLSVTYAVVASIFNRFVCFCEMIFACNGYKVNFIMKTMQRGQWITWNRSQNHKNPMFENALFWLLITFSTWMSNSSFSRRMDLFDIHLNTGKNCFVVLSSFSLNNNKFSEFAQAKIFTHNAS